MANYDCSELRNRIYDFCVEGRIVVESSTSCGPSQTLWHSTSAHEADKPYVSNNKYRGLTQVCKLLRNEFRPGYMAATTVSFDWPEKFILYAAAFYPGRDTQEIREYHGKFVFNMSGNHNLGLDILPMLQFLAVAPNLRCSFFDGPEYMTCLNQLNELFTYTTAHRNEVWSRFLSAEVEDIRILLQFRYPQLLFRTRKEMALEPKEWWKKAGLPDLSRFDRVFLWGADVHGRCKGCITWNRDWWIL